MNRYQPDTANDYRIDRMTLLASASPLRSGAYT